MFGTNNFRRISLIRNIFVALNALIKQIKHKQKDHRKFVLHQAL